MFGASGTRGPWRAVARSGWAARLLAVLALGTGGAVLGLACGGTTGREDLPAQTSPASPGMDASVVTDSTVGGSVSLDEGLFDVAIVYVDRALPDVAAPSMGADDGGGSPYPSCPGFLPVDVDGDVLLGSDGGIELGNEFAQAPAAYNDAGSVVLAPDGSPCATYGWLGSTAIDECLVQDPPGQNDYQLLPPCNWCAEAGAAAQGTGAGESRYSLCMALYACMIQTGCGFTTVTSCICGPGSNNANCLQNPLGPCLVQEMASLEELPTSVEDALKNETSIDPSFLGSCGAKLNQMFKNAGGGVDKCFPADAGTKD
jgi:hypothetical protein